MASADRRMKGGERARFYAQLARLLDSGLAPRQALALLGEQGQSLSRFLEGGHSLARAWRMHPGFAEMEYRIVDGGEASGELSPCLEALSDHFERQSRLRKKILLKLLYPAILLHALFLLPPLGLLVSEGLAAYSRMAVAPLVLAWALIAVAAFAIARARSSPALAVQLDRRSLRLPLLGRILRDRSIALYSGGLALLLGAGLPVLTSLERAAGWIGNRWIRRQAESVATEVRRGAGLAESMFGLFPESFVEMVRVGEVSGKIDEQLKAASRFFDEEGQMAITRLVTIASFLSYFLVAIAVGVVVLRSYLAILL